MGDKLEKSEDTDEIVELVITEPRSENLMAIAKNFNRLTHERRLRGEESTISPEGTATEIAKLSLAAK